MSPDLRLATVYVMPLGGKDLAAGAGRARAQQEATSAARSRTPSISSSRPTSASWPTRPSTKPTASSGCWPARRSGRTWTSRTHGHAARRARPIHGWLVLDKPVGMTSTQAVGAVRRLFDARKAGHAGTLDPLATGVLPIALGEATKTVPYAVDGTKHYRFTVRWGAGTDTDDAEGRIVETSELRPAREADRGAAAALHRRDPADAAGVLRHQGRRQPRLRLGARGRGVELEARTRADRLAVAASTCRTPTRPCFEARCGKGTYVRALARDMGRDARLPRPSHRAAPHPRRSLRRGAGGAACRPSRPRQRRARRRCMRLLLPIEAALQDLAALNVGQNDAARLLRGQAVLIRGRDAPTSDRPDLCNLQGPPDRRRPASRRASCTQSACSISATPADRA